jgi:phosphoribosylamine--glycine ligase
LRILVIGSGGREHALCWAIAASPLCDVLYCAPGNAGIAREATCVPIAATDIDGILAFARTERIDFVVVGPEAPLVIGIVDRLEAAGVPAFGPTQAAARLEGSKAFAKELCRANGVPTARFERFADPAAAMAFVRRQGAPIVVKADGLTAGKGVVVASTVAEAEAAIQGMMSERRYGDSGTEVVVEECLVGEEASFFALVDGTTALPMAAAQDHKRVGDGDVGPNTGGMGAYSPAPIVTANVAEAVMERIVKPTVAAMAAAGHPYKGVLYAGLMIAEDGPKLIEFNARFGDPECQVLVPRLFSDLLPALIACRDGELDHFHLRWKEEVAINVVMAAKGYPEDPRKGSVIRGLDAAEAVEGVTVFHAGTRRDGGRLIADGGRVLGVTALASTLVEARRRAYAAIDRIDWPEGFCRRDIGHRALK